MVCVSKFWQGHMNILLFSGKYPKISLRVYWPSPLRRSLNALLSHTNSWESVTEETVGSPSENNGLIQGKETQGEATEHKHNHGLVTLPLFPSLREIN